jgi:four helix bundle protein
MKDTALEKSRKFAIKIYHLYKHLCEEKNETTLAKQMLRSGTLIGENLSKANHALGKKGLLKETGIALKECAATEFWLTLFKDTNLLTADEHKDIMEDCKEILSLLMSEVKTLSNDI